MTRTQKQDSKQIAEAVGLKYVSITSKGFGRQTSDSSTNPVRGEKFLYFDTHAKPITDPEEIARIDNLAIPPAYTDVWICPFANGHIQATGKDDRGRIQYKYHKDWEAARMATKFERMKDFGLALPKIRRVVNQDLNLPGIPREKILATLVQLLEKTLIRVGNEEYAQKNKSFGLTTMQNKHVEVVSGQITFAFKGKSNKFHEISLQDKKLAKIVTKLQDLPGQDLFQFVDDNDNLHEIHSDDINTYLQDITGQEFTAKDFRTWKGTVFAANGLMKLANAKSDAEAKRNLNSVIKEVSKELGNTPAVCRKAYIHPDLINTYLVTKSSDFLTTTVKKLAKYKNLHKNEAPIMVFLETR